MAKQVINVGRSENDNSGDLLRTAFIKVNENFTELYDSGGVIVDNAPVENHTTIPISSHWAYTHSQSSTQHGVSVFGSILNSSANAAAARSILELTTVLYRGDVGVVVQAHDDNIVIDPAYVHTDNNFTNSEKLKLASISPNAEVNVNADWNATVGDAFILNKPNFGTAAFTNITDYATAAQGLLSDSALQPSDVGVGVQPFNPNTVIDSNYVHTDNNFTTGEKNKLSGIAPNAECRLGCY